MFPKLDIYLFTAKGWTVHFLREMNSIEFYICLSVSSESLERTNLINYRRLPVIILATHRQETMQQKETNVVRYIDRYRRKKL